MRCLKTDVIVAIITVVLSISGAVGGAWLTINGRVYEVEKRIAIVELDIDNTKALYQKQDENISKIYELFYKIDKNITEINGKLNLKEDKKWK